MFDMKVFAAWLAFGVFDSASSVKMLTLRAVREQRGRGSRLTWSQAWVEVFRRVWGSDLTESDLAAADFGRKEEILPEVSDDVLRRKDHCVVEFTCVGGLESDGSAMYLEHATAVVQFLDVIGQKWLVLQLPEMALRDEDFGPLLRACPRLVELNVANNGISDISPLLDLFVSGESRIRVVNVAQRVVVG